MKEKKSDDKKIYKIIINKMQFKLIFEKFNIMFKLITLII